MISHLHRIKNEGLRQCPRCLRCRRAESRTKTSAVVGEEELLLPSKSSSFSSSSPASGASSR